MENPYLTQGLIKLLAGTLVLRCKVRFFAWSLGTESFGDTRPAFDEDYRVLDGLCDAIATRIVELGGTVPGAYTTLLTYSSIKEDSPLSIRDMIATLVKDHQQLIADAQLVAILADPAPDPVSETLILRCIEQHECCGAHLSELMPNPNVLMN